MSLFIGSFSLIIIRGKSEICVSNSALLLVNFLAGPMKLLSHPARLKRRQELIHTP